MDPAHRQADSQALAVFSGCHAVSPLRKLRSYVFMCVPWCAGFWSRAMFIITGCDVASSVPEPNPAVPTNPPSSQSHSTCRCEGPSNVGMEPGSVIPPLLSRDRLGGYLSTPVLAPSSLRINSPPSEHRGHGLPLVALKRFATESSS